MFWWIPDFHILLDVLLEFGLVLENDSYGYKKFEKKSLNV
jgi:hypothetical protein